MAIVNIVTVGHYLWRDVSTHTAAVHCIAKQHGISRLEPHFHQEYVLTTTSLHSALRLTFLQVYANTLLANLNARDAIRYNMPFLKEPSFSFNLTPIESARSPVDFASVCFKPTNMHLFLWR